MRQGFLRGYSIRPDRLQQFLLGYHAVWIFREIAQQLEILPPQRNLPIRGSQRVARDIERISLELQHLERRPTAPAVSRPRGDEMNFIQIKAFSAKLHNSVRTASSFCGNISAIGSLKASRRSEPQEAGHEASAPSISASGRRCCRAPGFVALRLGTSLSDAPHHHDRAVSARRYRR